MAVIGDTRRELNKRKDPHKKKSSEGTFPERVEM
jgi:hypothetical protein